jgi:hypothetical protein
MVGAEHAHTVPVHLEPLASDVAQCLHATLPLPHQCVRIYGKKLNSLMGGGAVQQDRRSRVRILMSLGFFNLPNVSCCCVALGLTQLEQK